MRDVIHDRIQLTLRRRFAILRVNLCVISYSLQKPSRNFTLQSTFLISYGNQKA